jgi:pimeloyl-ACP methyl ester carboxylesterase
MGGAVRASLSAALLLAALSGAEARAGEPGSLERSVCGWLSERVGFLLLRTVAGRPRLTRPEEVTGLDRIRFRTEDDRLLGGYRLRAAVAAGRPRGYVLVAQGNAMLAEHTVPLLRFFSAAGFDAFAYDFRGYGLSEGRSRLAAILSDYVEITRHLNRQGYDRAFLYGASLGGVIFLHAIDAGVSFDAAVIDSAPSRIQRYGCPEELDPVNRVPLDCSKLMVVVGGRDRVVPASDSRALTDLVQARGGALVRREDFAHPFQDRDAATTLARWRLALGFFDAMIGGG